MDVSLKPDVAMASEVSISSKNSLAITDFFAKRTQLANYCGKPPPGTPPIRDFQLVLRGFNVSSAALESGNASGAFRQTPTPILEPKNAGPMDARFLSSVGLGFGTRIGSTVP